MIDKNETVVNAYANIVRKLLAEENDNSTNERLVIAIIATVIANKMGGLADKFQVGASKVFQTKNSAVIYVLDSCLPCLLL